MTTKLAGQVTTREVLELRLAGKSYAQIGDELGLTAKGARIAVHRAYIDLAVSIKETTQELRAVELLRLDEMQSAIWANKSDPFILKQLVQISHQRCKILGLYAPTEHKLSKDTDLEDLATEITEIGNALIANNKAEGASDGSILLPTPTPVDPKKPTH